MLCIHSYLLCVHMNRVVSTSCSLIVVETNIALNHHYPFTGLSLGFKVLSLQPFRLYYLYLLFYATYSCSSRNVEVYNL